MFFCGNLCNLRMILEIGFGDGDFEMVEGQPVNETINPPADPYDGSAEALVNSRFWDPLQRAGQQ